MKIRIYASNPAQVSVSTTDVTISSSSDNPPEFIEVEISDSLANQYLTSPDKFTVKVKKGGTVLIKPKPQK